MTPFYPPAPLADRIARALGRRPDAYFTFAGGGYTPALRLRAQFADGSLAFVKVATSDNTATWLRTELKMYAYLSGASFLPALLGADAGDANDLNCPPFLILEDLFAAHWPPPWTTGQIDAVLAALAEVRASTSRVPTDFPRFESYRTELTGWVRVAADPEPFLRLGFCSRTWLDAALPTLLAGERDAVFDGGELLHGDIRSDNLCFRADGRAVLIDWNFACLGNATFDLSFFLPSLHSEGGPAPEAILPDCIEGAVIAAGYFAAQAGLPPPPGAPRVRDVQRTQLAVALPWAARALNLPPTQA